MGRYKGVQSPIDPILTADDEIWSPDENVAFELQPVETRRKRPRAIRGLGPEVSATARRKAQHSHFRTHNSSHGSMQTDRRRSPPRTRKRTRINTARPQSATARGRGSASSRRQVCRRCGMYPGDRAMRPTPLPPQPARTKAPASHRRATDATRLPYDWWHASTPRAR